jgi:hypothetical protein
MYCRLLVSLIIYVFISPKEGGRTKDEIPSVAEGFNVQLTFTHTSLFDYLELKRNWLPLLLLRDITIQRTIT